MYTGETKRTENIENILSKEVLGRAEVLFLRFSEKVLENNGPKHTVAMRFVPL